MTKRLLPCAIETVAKLSEFKGDTICIINRNSVPKELELEFEERRKCDDAFDTEISCFNVPGVPFRIVYSPIGELKAYDDVRSFQKATELSISRAIKAGSKQPLLIIPEHSSFHNIKLCSILASLRQLYIPIQLREDLPEKQSQLLSLSILIDNYDLMNIIKEAQIIERGYFVARDIGIGDPERMSPPNVETYIKNMYSNITIESISDINVLKKEFPLFAAVTRAANTITRHQGRIIFLEYKPPQKAVKSLLLVGKGVTYDTGGADIKAGGIMAGMSRDKCGAATVAGFMKVVDQMQPHNIHVIAALCMVRNSVGEESYVADEIITSRAGVRVRVGNTDAEGRMCMTDALCKMKELAYNLPDPHLFTIATLTGHAILAVGEGYTIVMDNSVGRKNGHAEHLKKIGDNIGEPFEISTLRPDDFEINKSQVIGEDVVQANNLSSSRTNRGHQMPMGFMIVASGLDKHELFSDQPIKYSHLDIAASAGEYPKIPTGAPIISLVKTHLTELNNSI